MDSMAETEDNSMGSEENLRKVVENIFYVLDFKLNHYCTDVNLGFL